MSGAVPFLTASRVDLFRRCSGSATLPQTYESSGAAERGTEAHADALRVGHLPRLFLDWFGGEPRYEVALALEVGGATPRALMLGENLEREYDLPDPTDGAVWVAGTADAARVSGGVLRVGDLKTGYAQARGSLGPPERSGQLLLLAWMLWRYLAARRASEESHRAVTECWVGSRGPHWCLTHSRRLSDCRDAGRAATRWEPRSVEVAWLVRPVGDGGAAGDPVVEAATLSPAWLRDWAGRFSGAVLRARADVPRLRPGEHCDRCDRFDACPSQGLTLKRLSDLPGDLVTDEDAAHAHFAIAAAERLIRRGRESLRSYVERREAQLSAAGGVVVTDATVTVATTAAPPVHSAPATDPRVVPIGGGRGLRVVRGSRSSIDALRAVATGLVPPEAAVVSMTRESIARVAPAGTDVDALVSELEALGAVTRHPTAPHVRVVNVRD